MIIILTIISTINTLLIAYLVYWTRTTVDSQNGSESVVKNPVIRNLKIQKVSGVLKAKNVKEQTAEILKENQPDLIKRLNKGDSLEEIAKEWVRPKEKVSIKKR